MLNTYKLMSNLLVEENKKYTNEELVIKYQEKEDMRVLAELFCRNFPLYFNIYKKPAFYRLDSSDKVSIILEKLSVAINTWKVERNIRFITYSTHIMVMELVNKCNYYKHKVRNKIREISSSDILGTNKDEEETLDYEQVTSDTTIEQQFDLIELKYSIQNSNMSEREKMFCNIILDNPRITQQEIADIMKIGRQTVIKIKNRIGEKVLRLCTTNY